MGAKRVGALQDDGEKKIQLGMRIVIRRIDSALNAKSSPRGQKMYEIAFSLYSVDQELSKLKLKTFALGAIGSGVGIVSGAL